MNAIRLINENDLDKFITFWNQFDDNTENQQHLKNCILDKNPNIAIGAIFKNNDITGCLIGNTIDYNWPKKNIMPIFVLRGMKGIFTTHDERDALIRLTCGYFHERQFFTFYMSYKLKNFSTYENCHEKIDKWMRRAYSTSTSEEVSYMWTVESLIPYSVKWEDMPLVYQQFVNKGCKENETSVVIRADVKYHLREKYLK